MGYNFFNTREVSGVFDQKLNNFRASLGSAISKGENISFADNKIYSTYNKIFNLVK